MNKANRDIQLTISKSMRGVTRKVDLNGRMGNIPIDFRKALGIDRPGAEVEIFLLDGGLFLRKIEVDAE